MHASRAFVLTILVLLAACGQSSSSAATQAPDAPRQRPVQTLAPREPAPTASAPAESPRDDPASSGGATPSSPPSASGDPAADACSVLGAEWSTQRLLGRGIDFHAPLIPDTSRDFQSAERGALTFYHGTAAEGYDNFWDAWWIMWSKVIATMDAPANQSRWLVVEHDGRFYPFEARTSGFQFDPEYPDVRPPSGPCRITTEDGLVVAWTALGLVEGSSFNTEWARYSWFAPGRIDCSTLAHPCGPGGSGTEWWCIEAERYPDVAAGWGSCQVSQSSSGRDELSRVLARGWLGASPWST